MEEISELIPTGCSEIGSPSGYKATDFLEYDAVGQSVVVDVQLVQNLSRSRKAAELFVTTTFSDISVRLLR